MFIFKAVCSLQVFWRSDFAVVDIDIIDGIDDITVV